ncbi:MAG: hypothetical protein IJX17_01830 [Clostridia bacterium]|nr:hypothetical protein [Clostridia bacterium]
MSVLDLILEEKKWLEFLDYKITQSNLSKIEEQELKEFVLNKNYLPIATSIFKGEYSFSFPKKSLINKMGSTKKRVVYTFNKNENLILKFIVYLMKDYDKFFASNCYAFRTGQTVKKALNHIISTPNIDDYYAYKLDISNYFNTILVDKFLPILKKFLNDEKLFNLFKNILTNNKCYYNNEIIEENRGVMAGTPFSTILANIYLTDIDKYFESNNILYARYSDDIIIFLKTITEIEDYKNILKFKLKNKSLKINTNKEILFKPHTSWNFLGFSYNNKEIDLSPITLQKIKDKIRRKTRAIYRWKIKNNKSTEHSIKVLIRVFNNKFYRETNTKDLTWCKWYFPIITTHKSLKIIDEYLISYLRFLSSGRFTKKNFNITYNYLKSLGFKSLVNEYYKFLEK